MSIAIKSGEFKQAEFVRNIFSATPEANTKFEDVLKPAFWAHIAAKLHPYDRIEVTDKEGEWFAELLVVACTRNEARVAILRFVEINPVSLNTVSETKVSDILGEDSTKPVFKVAFKGDKKKHCVIRKIDNEIIKEGFVTAADADAWLVEYEAKTLV